MKPSKKQMTENLNWYFLNLTGFRRINGGYADTKIKSIKSLGKGKFSVKGEVKYGEQDMGDGCSVEYTNTFELKCDKKCTKVEN